MKFRPDIEGLRALAIAPVVVFHAFPALMPGGYVGVDVFFVISGFLITQLLMQRLDTGQYSILSFYGARVRRIFPALFFMLAMGVPAAIWLLPPDGLFAFGRTLRATAVFFSNVELYRTTDYFDTATELKPLVHTWSLAVEEQYYIVFPLVLALLHRHWHARITVVLACAGVASLALSIWWVHTDAPLAFYSAVSRTFELMLGSLLAVVGQGARIARRLREVLALLGLALIISACFGFGSQTPFPGVSALLPCIGAALVIWAGGKGETRAGRLLSMRPVRFLGAQSFSLYLWHWPILVFTRHWSLGELTHLQAGLAILASVLMAQFSLRWVEMPVRRASHSDSRLLLFGAAGIALTLALATVLVYRTADVQKLTAYQQRLHQGAQDFSKHRRRCHDGVDDVVAYKDRCRFGDLASQRYTVVWGDSHGAELAPALGEVAAAHGRAVVQITSSGCPPASGFSLPKVPLCMAHNDETLAALLNDANIDRVVMIARYEHYQRIDSAAFEAGLLRSVQALTSAGRKVVVVEPVPIYGYSVPAALASLAGRGVSPISFGKSLNTYRQEEQETLQLLRRIARLPSVQVLHTGEILCGTGRCDVLAGDEPLYFDDDHLSMTGARRLAAALRE